MRNIALTLSYDGSAYHGWQVQKTERTVGQTMEEAAARVLGHPVKAARLHIAQNFRPELFRFSRLWLMPEKGAYIFLQLIHFRSLPSKAWL